MVAAIRIAAHTPGVGCQCPREQYGPYSQIIVVVGLDSPGSSLKDLHKTYLCFAQLGAFPGLEQLPKQLLPKAFKGPSIGSSNLGQRMTVRTINTETIKPGKEEVGKGDTWENKDFKSSHVHLGIKKATCMPRAGCMLKKTLKRS